MSFPCDKCNRETTWFVIPGTAGSGSPTGTDFKIKMGSHGGESDQTALIGFTTDGHGCSEYKINCNLNEDHPFCNGEERTDGIKVCDQPDHPAYKFCKGED